MAHKTLQEHSRKNWGRDELQVATLDEIKLGALLRIADATELMANRYSELLSDLDRCKHSAAYWRDQSERQTRRINSMKGVITKLRRKGPKP